MEWSDRELRVVGTFLLAVGVFMLTAAGYAYGGWENAAWVFMLSAPWAGLYWVVLR